MELVPHSPEQGVYPPTGDYVHAMEVRGASRLLFVSDTTGLDAAAVPGRTVDEQLELIWSNLRAILASAGSRATCAMSLTPRPTPRRGWRRSAAG